MLGKGVLPVTRFDLAEILSWRSHRKPRLSKRILGKSIDERPTEESARNSSGHWESDTVLERKKGGQPAVSTLVEHLTRHHLSIRIVSRTAVGVATTMEQLNTQYGDRFSQVFRSITTDNGNALATFPAFEALATGIYCPSLFCLGTDSQ